MKDMFLDPPFVTSMADVIVEEGSNFTQICIYQNGVPANTSVLWTRSTDGSTWISDKLLLNSLNRTLDNATFTCLTSNTMFPTGGQAKIGTDAQSFRMNVLCKCSFS